MTNFNIYDRLNDITLIMQSLEQQGKTDTKEYKNLEKEKAALLKTINAR